MILYRRNRLTSRANFFAIALLDAYCAVQAERRFNYVWFPVKKTNPDKSKANQKRNLNQSP